MIKYYKMNVNNKYYIKIFIKSKNTFFKNIFHKILKLTFLKTILY
jgi:hypothetical protein